MAAVFADRLRIGSGNLVFARYVGEAALSRRAAEIATENGLDTLVSGNRAMLADFFYTLRDSGLALYAEPVEGFPPHHYAQSLPAAARTRRRALHHPRSPTARLAAHPASPRGRSRRWTPEEGFVTREIHAFRVSRRCWYPGA